MSSDDLELKAPPPPEAPPSRWVRWEREWPRWAAMAAMLAVTVYYVAGGAPLWAVLFASGLFAGIAWGFFRSVRRLANDLYAIRTSPQRGWPFRIGMGVGAAGWFLAGGRLPTSRQELIVLLWLAGAMAAGGYGVEALDRISRRIREERR